MNRRILPTRLPTVAIVGRPNVGKSTLVNRLVGRRDAIVEQKPGVTRDRTTHETEWRGRRVALVDTGGWTPGWARSKDSYDDAVSAQAERATIDADLIVFVVDATVGVTEEDSAAAGWLRALAPPVLLVANKVDRAGFEAELAELYALGLGDPVPVSAQHGRGSGDLLDDILDVLRSTGAFERAGDIPGDDIPGVALIGRPNVGKSSLFNRLLGEERTIVDDRPGTTRDAVDTIVEVEDGAAYRFVDTAGLRRKYRHGEPTEYYSTVRTVQALESAAVALLVIDAWQEIGEQEQKLARQILDAGRALVIVLNKWDLLDEYRREWVDRELDRLLHFVAWAPLVRTSALSGRGVDKLLPAVDAVLDEWLRRIPTSQLNDWLADAVAATAPPMHLGRNVRIRYVTQVAVGPPTFRLFTTAELSPGYIRYLERRLRESFGFDGTPLDLAFRVRARWEDRDRRPAANSPSKRRR
ncbi:MAG: ribosome biogenesis GTPase Der [Nitriliruptorales bacterium]|nr:ribosome biogenesis GTPase Der [Nitriliruptorales bacterium]